jgi:hypothetical protein
MQNHRHSFAAGSQLLINLHKRSGQQARHAGSVLTPTRFSTTGTTEVYPLWFQMTSFHAANVLDSSGMNEVYDKYFRNPKPARSYFGATGFRRAGQLLQIDCIAYVD